MSRLSGDVYRMTQPWSVLINSVTTNIIMLAGGLIMCVHTSWRLSAVALSSIVPIIYITGIYAKWAGKISYEIQQAMSKLPSASLQTGVLDLETPELHMVERHMNIYRFAQVMHTIRLWKLGQTCVLSVHFPQRKKKSTTTPTLVESPCRKGRRMLFFL